MMLAMKDATLTSPSGSATLESRRHFGERISWLEHKYNRLKIQYFLANIPGRMREVSLQLTSGGAKENKRPKGKRKHK